MKPTKEESASKNSDKLFCRILNDKDAEDLVRQIEERHIDKLDETLLLTQDGKLELYFAPHNLYISPKTQILIVGVCPGRRQSEIALEAVAKGKGIITAKKEARFFGQTKKNLLEMLDDLGIEKILHQNAKELLEDLDSGLDSIALIPFSVFVGGKNYSGHSPAILKTPLLMDYMKAWFLPALQKLPDLKILIPLGKGVEEVLDTLQKRGEIPASVQILQGFPHPSGLNTSRKKVFASNQDAMKQQLQEVFSSQPDPV